MNLRLALTFIVSLLVGACASTPGGSSSTYGGGRLQLKLNQPVTINAGSSYAYIKAPGQVVAGRNDVGTYELFCKFAVPRSKDSPAMTIQPDTFQINNVYRRYAYVAPVDTEFEVAGFGIGIGGGGGYGGFGGMNRGSKVDIELRMDLSSASQPQVKYMSCVRFMDPYLDRGRGPNLQQAQQVLGSLAEIVPVGAPVN